MFIELEQNLAANEQAGMCEDKFEVGLLWDCWALMWLDACPEVRVLSFHRASSLCGKLGLPPWLKDAVRLTAA